MARISIETGNEGPTHDPYSYVEVTVTRTSPKFSGSVTMHSGLVEWVKVDGEQYGPHNHSGSPAELFEQYAGVSLDVATNAFHEASDRKIRYHSCGLRYIQEGDGFPGESITYCAKCGETFKYRFNRSAVE